MGGRGEQLTLNTPSKPHSLWWNFVFSQNFLRALRARTKKCASQYEAFRGVIRKVVFAKKVAKKRKKIDILLTQGRIFLVWIYLRPHLFSSQSKFGVKYGVREPC